MLINGYIGHVNEIFVDRKLFIQGRLLMKTEQDTMDEIKYSAVHYMTLHTGIRIR